MDEDMKKERTMGAALGETLTPAAGRQSADRVLRNIIEETRKKADDFEIILGMLPRQMTRAQETALWRLLVSIKI